MRSSIIRRVQTYSVKKTMNSTDKYLFDLNGFIIVRNVFSSDEVKLMNSIIDKHAAEVLERDDSVRNTPLSTPLSGDGKKGRIDLGRILEWGKDSKIFRSILDHPKLIPFFNGLLGQGYRMDHLPFVIMNKEGSEGFSLHGGTIDCRSGNYSPHIAYSCVNQQMNCGLLGVSVAISGQQAGDGGFIIVPGSHKSNFPAPVEMINGSGEDFKNTVIQPVLNPGDVLLFSEGTVHGASPWNNSSYDRRLALYRFAPATNCYGRSYYPTWPADMYYSDDKDPESSITPAQRSVLAPPYALRVDREYLTVSEKENGEAHAVVKTCFREERKKVFDKKVFNTEYF